MNRISILGHVLVGLVLTTSVPSLFADENTEVHGNVKVGALVNTSGQNAYDGAAGKSYLIDNTLVGRLGNEPGQSYGLDVVQNFPGLDGTWAKAHFTFEGYALNFATAAYTSNKPTNKTADGSTKGFAPYVTQAFVEMGGFSWDPKASLWAGSRYYGGDGIAVSGFNFVDRSGAGLGVEGLWGGAFDVALLTDDSLMSGNSATSLPLNLQFKVRLGDHLSLEALGARAVGAKKVTGAEANADLGGEVMATVDFRSFYGLAPGSAKLTLQAGFGMLGNAETTTADGWSQLGKLGSVWTLEKSSSYRVVSYGLFTLGDFDVMPAFWVQYDTVAGSNPRLTASAVVRPVWHADRNLAFLLEAGVADKIGALNGAEGLAYKVTLAPTLTLESDFWALPQIRLLASWQSRDQKLGFVGPNRQLGDLWVGVQTEARW